MSDVRLYPLNKIAALSDDSDKAILVVTEGTGSATEAEEIANAIGATAASIDTALSTATTTQEDSIRNSLKAAGKQIGFFDRFDRADRYLNAATITHKVSAPEVGSLWYWALNDASPATGHRKMQIHNGALRVLSTWGGYLAGHATPADATDFSYGFEFTREVTQFTSGSAGGFTIAVGKAPLVQEDGSTHNAPGRIHINLVNTGVESIGVFNGGLLFQGNASTDECTTTTAHGFQTGDMIGTATGAAGLPGGIVAATSYFAIRVSDTVFKFATTRANALAGTAIDLTTNGSADQSIQRFFEPLNRQLRSNHWPWAIDPVTVLLFQGNDAANNLTTTVPHGLLNGDQVLLEGSGLPAGLSENTPYFVVNRAASTLQLSTTLGGSAIELTSNGSANQVIRGPRQETASRIPASRRSLVIVGIRGDIISITLAGVGTVSFYYRDLASLFTGGSAAAGGTVGFYWQSTPPRSSSVNFLNTYPLHAAWIDAPVIEADYLRRHAGYAASIATDTNHRLPGRLELVDANSILRSTAIGGLGQDIRIVTGNTGSSTKGAQARGTGGNAYFEGLILNNPTFLSAGASLVGVAPSTIQGLDGNVVSGAGAETAILGWSSISGLETGETEEHTLCGFLTGTNAKRIRVVYTGFSGSGNVFDSDASGTPLNAIATPFMLKIERKQTASVSHQTYATMWVNGTVIGPQRLSLNLSADFRNMELRTTTTDASAVTVDHLRTTIHRTKPQ